jgi:broad specificity phosphatase PhoE
MDSSDTSTSGFVHIIRHGEALHNVDRASSCRDPPLTEAGHNATQTIQFSLSPDLILISPMTRTIQTAMNIFPFLRAQSPFPTSVQIWPDLRETHDARCNKGHSRAEMQAKFPQLDFAECHEEWDYAPHSIEDATERAERVRARLKALSGSCKNIAVVTHRGLISFLVKGRRFDVCEHRSYRFATEDEVNDEKVRLGLNCDTLQEQDFGPTVLVFVRNRTAHEEINA